MRKPGEAVEALRIAAEMRGRAVADIGQPHRIELVQRRHRPVRVPPLAGEPRKSRHFVLVDGFGAVRLRVHAKAFSWTASCDLIFRR